MKRCKKCKRPIIGIEVVKQLCIACDSEIESLTVFVHTPKENDTKGRIETNGNIRNNY